MKGKLTFSILLIVVYSAVVITGQWSLSRHQKVPTCATLFEGDNYSGNKSEVKSSTVITDTSLIGIWNQTASIRIEQGCTFTICGINSSRSREDCHQIQGDFNGDLPTEWHVTSTIGYCDCKKSCSCQNIFLRRTECARAYLDSDCNSCDAVYTSLEHTENEATKSIPQQFQSKVAAIKVNTGCTVRAQGERETGQQPVGEITHQQSKYDWTGQFLHYQCQCDQTKRKPRRNQLKKEFTGGPVIVEMPKLAGAIHAKLKGDYQDHPGLLAGLQSLSTRRNSRHVYILLLGLTGSGKSTTINFLFDNSTITKVGDQESTTSDIHEYRIRVPVDELGLQNTELRIIDTPGIVDTRGMEQDARYLATLDTFLRNHEDLKRSIPNVVLVLTRFDDNRFSGHGSNFVKMLRTISLFQDRLVDKSFSNVIFVATHFMSERKELTRQPFERIQALKRVIEEYSLLPKPTLITVAENLPDKSDLLSVNGFYALPNGEFYPKNLFDKIQYVTSNGGDPIGEAVISTAFKYCDLDNITQVITPIVASTHGQVTKYLGILSSMNLNPAKTQVSQKLDATFETMPDELKLDQAEDILGNLQRILYLSHVLTFSDLPKSKGDIFDFLKNVPKHPVALYLLQRGLNISVPVYEPDRFIGFSYSLIQDTALGTTSPLNLSFGDTDFILTDIGVQVPKLYIVQLKTNVRSTFHISVSTKDYLKYRMKLLTNSVDDDNDVQIPSAMAEFFESSSPSTRLKPGLNLIDMTDERSESGRGSPLEQLSALIEYESFQVTLNKDLVHLNDHFLSTLEELQEFNETDWNIVNNWREFFSKYGTHIVESCNGGGAIEIRVKVPDTSTGNHGNDNGNGTTTLDSDTLSDLYSKQERLSKGISTIIEYIANLLIGKETFLSTADIEYSVHFQGGDYKYFVSNLSDVDARRKLGNWKSSLQVEPAMLSGELKLIPLTQLVKGLRPDLATKLKDAASILFNGTLHYRPLPTPKTRSSIPSDRADTQLISANGDSSGNQFVIMKEFASIFQVMAEQSRIKHEQLIDMMTQQQRDERQIALQEERQRREDRQKDIELDNENFRQIHANQVAQREQDGLQFEQVMKEEEIRSQQRREDQRLERAEFISASEALEKRNQQFLALIIENNRRMEESRKNSFWDKLGDGVIKGVSGAIPMLPALFAQG